MAIKTDGSIYEWGKIGNEKVSTPRKIGFDNDWRFVAIADFRPNSSSIHASTVAIKTDGSLYAWGSNNANQLGIGNSMDLSSPTRIGTDNDWRTASVGNTHTAAIKIDGSLYAWGRNYDGNFGNGTTTDSMVPIKIGTDTDWHNVSVSNSFTVAMKKDGSLYSMGRNDSCRLGLNTCEYYKQKTPKKIQLLWP